MLTFILQMSLIFLRAFKLLDWSWPIVFIPTFIFWGVILLVTIILLIIIIVDNIKTDKFLYKK